MLKTKQHQKCHKHLKKILKTHIINYFLFLNNAQQKEVIDIKNAVCMISFRSSLEVFVRIKKRELFC